MKRIYKKILSIMLVFCMTATIIPTYAYDNMNISNYQEMTMYSGDSERTVTTFEYNGADITMTLIQYDNGIRDVILSEDGNITKYSNEDKDGYVFVETKQEQELVINTYNGGYSYKTTEYYNSYISDLNIVALTAIIATGLGVISQGVAVAIAGMMITAISTSHKTIYFKHSIEGKQEWNGSRLVFKYRLNNYWSSVGYFSNTFYAGENILESLDPIWG